MAQLTTFFADLVRVETRLYNAVEDRLRAEHGMTAGQFTLLSIIRDRVGCRVLDLVHDTAITVGAASKAVDRLEAAGWCRREAHPGDRRSSLLVLTPAGEAALAAATPTFEDELAARVGTVLDAAQLDGALAALTRLRTALERPAARRGGG